MIESMKVYVFSDSVILPWEGQLYLPETSVEKIQELAENKSSEDK